MNASTDQRQSKSDDFIDVTWEVAQTDPLSEQQLQIEELRQQRRIDLARAAAEELKAESTSPLWLFFPKRLSGSTAGRIAFLVGFGLICVVISYLINK